MYTQQELNYQLLKSMYSDRAFFVMNQTFVDESFFPNETFKFFIHALKTVFTEFGGQLPTEPLIRECAAENENVDMQVLDKIFKTEIDQTNKEFFIRDVPKNYRKRKLLPAISEGVSNLKKLETDEHYLEEFYTKLQEIIIYTKKRDGGLSVYDVDERYVEVEQEYGTPFKTGYHRLENLIHGGFYRKRLYMWSAPPGYYKSALLCNLAAELFKTGQTVVFYSLELSRADISMRCDQILAHMESEKIRRDKNMLKNHIQVYQQGGSGNIYYQELPDSATVADIEANNEFIRLESGKNIDAVIVDYVDLMAPMKKEKGWGSYEAQGQVTRELRNLAKLYNVCCLTVTQSTRNALEEGGTKEEGGMEYVADSFNKPRIADFFAQLVMTKSDRQMGIIKMHIAKNRMGPADAKLAFNINSKLLCITEREAQA